MPSTDTPAVPPTNIRFALDPFLWLGALWVGYGLVLPRVASDSTVEVALVGAIAIYFVALLARVIRTSVRFPQRRTPLLLLASGITLWAAGSATVNAAETVSTVTFPSPSEVLFLLSYLGMAAFLLTEVPRRRRLPPLTLTLETIVICGAMACMAAVVVVTPISLSFDRGGVALLLAVLYPLIDLALATIVIAQMLLHQRDPSLRTAALALGFVLLAVADTSFVLTLSSMTYSSNVALRCLGRQLRPHRRRPPAPRSWQCPLSAAPAACPHPAAGRRRSLSAS